MDQQDDKSLVLDRESLAHQPQCRFLAYRADGRRTGNCSLLGRFDPNCRPLPPVVRYVTPLRFSDGPDPYTEIDAALEAESAARRASRRPFNVVKTVMLPPLDVPEMSIDDFLKTRESRSAALGRRTSLSPSLSSSGESDDTVVPSASPASSDGTSPEEGRFEVM